jgi:hypothetical protein
MAKRTGHQKVLSSAQADGIGQAASSTTPARRLSGAEEEGYEVVLVNSYPPPS